MQQTTEMSYKKKNHQKIDITTCQAGCRRGRGDQLQNPLLNVYAFERWPLEYKG